MNNKKAGTVELQADHTVGTTGRVGEFWIRRSDEDPPGILLRAVGEGREDLAEAWISALTEVIEVINCTEVTTDVVRFVIVLQAAFRCYQARMAVKHMKRLLAFSMHLASLPRSDPPLDSDEFYRIRSPISACPTNATPMASCSGATTTARHTN